MIFMNDPGYSGRSLKDKLGFAEDKPVWSPNAPEHYWRLIAPITRAQNHTKSTLWHLFFTRRADAETFANDFVKFLPPAGTLWVSWPKKSAVKSFGIDSDLSEQDFRDLLLPIGLVDIKVCAIDETWSGLKFVWRKNP
jgi:hypothetical protein